MSNSQDAGAVATPRARVRRLNDAPIDPGGNHVLYWMTSARSTRWNFALQRAAEHCVSLRLPLLVLEPLRVGYPWACDRFRRFIDHPTRPAGRRPGLHPLPVAPPRPLLPGLPRRPAPHRPRCRPGGAACQQPGAARRRARPSRQPPRPSRRPRPPARRPPRCRRSPRRLVQHGLSRYATDRNHPARDATSGLSPYLHFGHISAHEIFHRIAAHETWEPTRLRPERRAGAPAGGE